jgi:hypothetical protein
VRAPRSSSPLKVVVTGAAGSVGRRVPPRSRGISVSSTGSPRPAGHRRRVDLAGRPRSVFAVPCGRHLAHVPPEAVAQQRTRDLDTSNVLGAGERQSGARSSCPRRWCTAHEQPGTAHRTCRSGPIEFVRVRLAGSARARWRGSPCDVLTVFVRRCRRGRPARSPTVAWGRCDPPDEAILRTVRPQTTSRSDRRRNACWGRRCAQRRSRQLDPPETSLVSNAATACLEVCDDRRISALALRSRVRSTGSFYTVYRGHRGRSPPFARRTGNQRGSVRGPQARSLDRLGAVGVSLVGWAHRRDHRRSDRRW